MRSVLFLTSLFFLFLSSPAQAGAIKDVSVSAGASAGVALGWVNPVIAPTLSLSTELGGEKLRWYTALEVSPNLYIDLADGGVFPIPPIGSLVMGPTLGGNNLRIGPYGYLGLYSAGGGLRAAAITKEGRRGGQHGWELRAALNVALPPSVTTTALYSWHLPMKKR